MIKKFFEWGYYFLFVIFVVGAILYLPIFLYNLGEMFDHAEYGFQDW